MLFLGEVERKFWLLGGLAVGVLYQATSKYDVVMKKNILKVLYFAFSLGVVII